MRTLAGMSAFDEGGLSVSDEHSLPERITGTRLSANTFSLIGQKVFLGRDFRAEDELQGADHVTILSYGLWQTRYGGDPSILGKMLKVNGDYHTIVGVMPQDMAFPQESRLSIPLIPTPQERQLRAANLDVIGRLPVGVSAARAETEMKGVAASLALAHPETNKNLEPSVRPFIDWVLDENDQQILKTLVGAVAFVLLIACANVANLLLSRAVQRSRETSVRLAIGASRWRIVRQLLVESVILSFLGGILGLVFAKAGVKMFTVAVAPLGIPYWIDWSMDMTAFVYLFAICFATGILFGLAPALQISKTNVNEGLKESGRNTSGSVRSRRLTSAFVIGEIALTIVLMVGAGLMVRSLLNRQGLNIGIRAAENLLTMQLSLPQSKYATASDWNGFTDRLSERLRSMPDLESVTLASHIPAGGAFSSPLKLADRDVALPPVAMLVVAPGYFRALGVAMERGREFTAIDGQPGAEAAIVNQRFAAQYWPREDPIGKRIQLRDGKWTNVVGVSPPIRQRFLRQQQVEATVYVPLRQVPQNVFRIIARTHSPQDAVTRQLRDEIRKLDADLPLFNIMTMRQYRDDAIREARILTTLFSVFAVIGLIRSVVGIYAVSAYATSQRTQEIGVRIALGASNWEVVWLVLRLGLRQLVVGLPVGMLGAYLTSRALASSVFQVTTTDTATFVSIPLILTIIIIAACLIPARSAAKLNPVAALRIE